MRDTFWQRLTRRVRRLHQQPDWIPFAGPNWPNDILDRPVTDRFHAKQGRSTGRLVLHDGSRSLTVYLKRHYRLPLWAGLLAAFWPTGRWSPATQEWHHLEWAREQGLPVPRAVAVGEFIGPWGQLQSFLAVEELTGMLPLHEAVPLAAERLDPVSFRRWKRGLVTEMARLTRELHGRHWFHKDLYLCHFYIPAADIEKPPLEWRGRVHLIDLHRLGRHAWTWPWWRVKDLAQLLYSSEVPGVDDRDRIWFWNRCLGSDRRTCMGRWLRTLVLLKWRLYRRHNSRRKQRDG